MSGGADPRAALDLVVPAYFHPAAAPMLWQRLTTLTSTLRLVVVNVHNGPGVEEDPAYRPVIEALQAAGVRLAGYVDTRYGRRPINAVADDVATWVRRYGVDGVFLDQVSSGLADLDHYAQLVVGVRAAGARFVALNPGTHPHPGYVDLANVTVTFEGGWTDYRNLVVPEWVWHHKAKRFCHLVHDVPREAFVLGLQLAADRHARSVFLTDGGGANPWDRMPAHLTAAVAAVQAPARAVAELPEAPWTEPGGLAALNRALGDLRPAPGDAALGTGLVGTGLLGTGLLGTGLLGRSAYRLSAAAQPEADIPTRSLPTSAQARTVGLPGIVDAPPGIVDAPPEAVTGGTPATQKRSTPAAANGSTPAAVNGSAPAVGASFAAVAGIAPRDGGADRRSADPLAQLSRAQNALCTRAVDPLEIAVGLEALGWTDEAAAQLLGRGDLFTLAERLYALTPRRMERHPIPSQLRWAGRPLARLLGGVCFAAPCLVDARVLASPGSPAGQLAVGLALLIGWSAGQAAMEVGSVLQAQGRAMAARSWLRAGVLAAVLAALLLTGTSLLAGASLPVALLAAGQLPFLLAAAAVIVRGRQSVVAAVLLPTLLLAGTIGAGLGAAAGIRAEAGIRAAAVGGDGAGVRIGTRWIGPGAGAAGSAISPPLLAAVAAAVIVTVLVALVLCRGGQLRRLGRELHAADLRAAGWQAGYGLVTGLLVVLLVLVAGYSSAGVVVLLPVLGAVTLAQLQLAFFRRRGSALLASTSSMRTFRGQALLAAASSLLLHTVAVAGLAYLVLIRIRPGSGSEGLAVVLAAWLIGTALYAALMCASLGAARSVVRVLAAAMALGILAMLLPVGPARVDLAPALAAGVLLVLAARTAQDPTCHL